ncbi:ROK family protein [Micromonospora sp. NPDC005305]|uniref:ROK family protein n=1 Tax=Micromonospora sp. NPDC005305 TaxID=3156875 RepID=UPI0033B313FA
MTFLAADIGGTKIAAALLASDGTIIGHVRTAATPSTGARAVLDTVVSLLTATADDNVEAAGISAAGVIDAATGTVLGATSSISGWPGTPIAEHLTSALGHPVHVLGDGHAFALGEAVYGVARDADSVLVLAVGTGVGGSYVTSRMPLLGGHCAAGHFGHLAVPQAVGIPCYCGRTGHLEAIASGPGILRWYREHGGHAGVESARDLFARVDVDPIAAEAIRLGAAAVGAAAGGLTNAFDPDLVVVTGGVSQGGRHWESALRDAYSATLIPALEQTPLVISEPTAWLALRGAAHYSQRREAAA